MSTKHDVSWWNAQIRVAKKFRETYGRYDEWNTLKAYVRNKYDNDVVLPYPIIYTSLRSTIPKIYYRDPYVMVRPHHPSFSIPARLREAALNYVVAENGTKNTMREIATNTFMFGRGPGIVGFNERPIVSVDDELARSVRKKKDDKHEFNVFKKDNIPWFSAVHPENHLVPFNTKKITDAPWAAQAVLRELDDLKNDPRYKKAAANLKGTHLPEDYISGDLKTQLGLGEGEDVDLVLFWEIHDYRTGQVMALIEGRDEWLRKPEKDESQVDGLPFVSCVFNPDTDYYWTTSDALQIEPQQLETNEIRTFARMHRKLLLLKFIAKDGAFDEEELEKLVSCELEDIMSIVKFTGNDISKELHEFQPHIPPDYYGWGEQIRQDVREITGLGRNQTGTFDSSSRRTATEAQMVQMGADARIDEKVDSMLETLKSAVIKMDKLMEKYWDDEMTIKVMGMDGRAYWVDYSAKEMSGEYKIDIDPESMVKQPPGQKKQELMQLIGSMQNSPGVNVPYLMRMLLQEYKYIDVMEALPEAPVAPMNAAEFVDNQNKMMQQMSQQGGGQPGVPQTAGGAMNATI